jgi:hypothetical protein
MRIAAAAGMRASLLVLATLVAAPVATAYAGRELPTGANAVVRFQGKVAAHLQAPGKITGNDPIARARGHLTIEGDQARLSFKVKKPRWNRVPYFGWQTITQAGRVTERGTNAVQVTFEDSIANREGLGTNLDRRVGIRSVSGSFELRTAPTGALEMKFINNARVSVPDFGNLGVTMTFAGDKMELK